MADDFTLDFTAQGTGNASEYAVSHNTSIAITAAKVEEKTTVATVAAETDLTTIDAKADFIIVINKDTTNDVRLRIGVTGAHMFDVKIPPLGYYIFNNVEMNVTETGAVFAVYTAATIMRVQATAADCIVKVLNVRS